MATYDQVSGVMEQMSYLPGAQLSASKIKVYTNHLTDLTVQELQFAADKIIETEEYFPSISKIRAIAKTYAAKATGVSGCPVCNGVGLVRHELPVSHPHFGILYPCPMCHPAKA
jgi:hypothetical protein